MKLKSKTLLTYMGILFLATNLLFAQDKLAQTGFQFLSVSQSARATALGGAYTTIDGSPNVLFYNPAGIARMDANFGVAVNYFNWIADIKHVSAAVTYSPSNGQYGTFGFSVQSVDYGKLEGTMVWQNAQGFIETGDFYPRAFAVGISYARALTNKFIVGGQIKLVGQELGSSALPSGVTKKNVANAVAADFGTIYNTGFKSLKFGMSVRNFSQEIKYEEESFQLPLTFQIGISMDMMDFFMPETELHKLIVSIDAAHPRAFREYINFGTEYWFMNSFALRAGYITGHHEYNYSLGVGLKQFGFNINYAFQPFGVFGAINQFSIEFKL